MPRNIGAVGTFGPTVSALPTTDLFDGRTCVYGGLGYIVEAGTWTPARGSGGGDAPGDVGDIGDLKASAALRPPSEKWLRLRDAMTLSRTTYPELFAALTGEVLVGTTAGSQGVTYPAGAEVWVGLAVEGPGIQAGTMIAGIVNATSLILSKTATTSGTGRSMRTLPYGVGDGSTTFGLPSPVGRAIVAAGAATGLTNRQPGTQWGTETHKLLLGEMPKHTHLISATYSASGLGDKVRMAQPNNTGIDYTPNGLIEPAGGIDAHPNTQPSVALPLYIRVTP